MTRLQRQFFGMVALLIFVAGGGGVSQLPTL